MLKIAFVAASIYLLITKNYASHPSKNGEIAGKLKLQLIEMNRLAENKGGELKF